MTYSMNIIMVLFTCKNEGTFYRAFPWAVYLAGRGHRVTLLCTAVKKRFRTTVSEERGVRIIETPSLWSGRYAMTRLTGLYGWGPLDLLARCKVLFSEKFDVIHTFEHHIHVAMPALLARRRISILIADGCDHYGKGGLPSYAYSPFRLYGFYRFLGWPLTGLLNGLERALRRRADRVTVISSYLRDRTLSFGVVKEKVHLIPGSAEIVRVQPRSRLKSRKKLGLPGLQNYVLFFGAGQFDLDFALEAFSRVLIWKPNSCFIILGRKDPWVMRKAETLGIQKRVLQTGWICEEALNDWLSCADVCLLPMKDHPVNQARWPNKIGFYMAAARPTVATRVGDVGELIAQRDIGLVSRVEPADFAAQILKLLVDKQRAQEMGEQARRLAEEEFAVSVQGEELEKVYAKALLDVEAQGFSRGSIVSHPRLSLQVKEGGGIQ